MQREGDPQFALAAVRAHASAYGGGSRLHNDFGARVAHRTFEIIAFLLALPVLLVVHGAFLLFVLGLVVAGIPRFLGFLGYRGCRVLRIFRLLRLVRPLVAREIRGGTVHTCCPGSPSADCACSGGASSAGRLVVVVLCIRRRNQIP